MLKIAPTIDARAAWSGDERECRKVADQLFGYFGGSVAAFRGYYGWTLESLVKVLVVAGVVLP